MWSVGVICYLLLSGLSPFLGNSNLETFSNISGIAYDFDDEAFDVTSEEAKNIITNYLSNSLEHTWLQLTPRSDPNFKEINTDKLKSFLASRCWKKACHQGGESIHLSWFAS